MLITFGAVTLVVRVEPELFQARSCLPCPRANNSSRIECRLNANQMWIERGIYQLLEDAPTRSSLCHRVPRYQASANMLNRNYEARITSPIPLYHSGRKVEAVIYHRDLDWGLIYKWPLILHSYRGTVKNGDATSEGACTEPFRSACIKYPKSTSLSLGSSPRDCLEVP